MTDTETRDAQTARKGRLTALVIAGTGIFWVLATIIGGEMGLSQRVRALFDLMALAGFTWALVLIYQIWRARQGNQR
jgi:threonine/homoserine/homoserine lactone efflux protein